jgi:hypothetical protein
MSDQSAPPGAAAVQSLISTILGEPRGQPPRWHCGPGGSVELLDRGGIPVVFFSYTRSADVSFRSFAEVTCEEQARMIRCLCNELRGALSD